MMLPPGRAMLPAKASSQRRSAPAKTIGIVELAARSDSAAEVLFVTLRLIDSPTSSVASVESRSDRPSANRHSIAMFWPSM